MTVKAFVLAIVAATAPAILEDGVLKLKASNIQNHINEHYQDGLMVLFYAEWCQHCHSFLSVFAEAAHELAGEATLAKIMDDEVAKQYNIQSFPSIRWFRHGRVVETRPTTKDEVVAGARRLRQDRCQVLTSADDVFERAGVRVVGFFKTLKTKAAKSYMKAVERFRYPVDFFVATNKLKESVFERARLNVTTGPTALMLKPYDYHAVTTTLESEKFAKWLEREMMPTVVPFLPQYMDMIFGGPLQMHAVLAVDEIEKETHVRDVFYRAAEKYRGKILFVIMFKPSVDEEDDESAEEARQQMLAIWHFLQIDRTPVLIASDMTVATQEKPQGQQTKFDGDLTTESAVVDFLAPFAAKHVARKAGLDNKMAEIMAEPKLQEMLRDPKMASMFQIIGMPQKLVDIYKDEL